MNNKIIKVGILVSVLVVPAFLFLMAHLLGDNHFELPRLAPLGTKSKNIKGFVYGDTVYHQIENFTFYDQDSVSFELNDWQSKIKVFSVIFTTCKVECPLITSNLTKLNSVYQNDSIIALLSITIDAETDKPSVLKEYRSLFEIENKNWKFLWTNSSNDLSSFLMSSLFLGAGESHKKSEEFFHTSKVVLVDPDGVIRGYFDATIAENVDELIGAIKILKSEYEN